MLAHDVQRESIRPRIPSLEQPLLEPSVFAVNKELNSPKAKRGHLPLGSATLQLQSKTAQGQLLRPNGEMPTLPPSNGAKTIGTTKWPAPSGAQSRTRDDCGNDDAAGPYRWKPECRPGKGKGEWRRDRGVLGKAQRDAMLAARNETGRPSNARGALRHSKIALRRGDECARARGARLRGAKARRQNPSTGRNRRCQVREQQRKLAP